MSTPQAATGPAVTVPVAAIQDVIATLEGTSCSFWACDGPDEPFVSMKTCNICSTVQDLRQLIGLPAGGEGRES